MDLKLRDEITKLLIASPGLSISEIAKKTDNYYSYTHKVISSMEKRNLLKVKKTTKGKKEATLCYVADAYKQKWIMDLKKFMRVLLKDAEVKAAFMLMYLFVAFTFVKKFFENGFAEGGTVIGERAVLSAPELGAVGAPEQAAQTVSLSFGVSLELVLLLIVAGLILIWFYRKKKRRGLK